MSSSILNSEQTTLISSHSINNQLMNSTIDDSNHDSLNQNEINHSKKLIKTRTPIPYRALGVLCVMRVTEPISYTLIFPFITRMLEDLKVTQDSKEIGYYAGLIESLFAIAQFCTAIFWGRLSDRIGRKPVMLTGLFGMAIGVISFGLQKSFMGLAISRSIAGMMNGNVAIVQSMVSEITDSTNFADTAAYLPICFAVGSIIGPILGGYLALPAQQFPNLFGNCTFLKEYPYFLPCLIGGLLNFVAIILGIFFLEETLESKRKSKPNLPKNSFPNYGTLSDSNRSSNSTSPVTLTQDSKLEPPSIRSLCTKPIMMVMLSFTLTHFQNIAWAATMPVYGYTKIENGGLGLSLDQIGFMLSTSGFGSIVVQLWLFSPLQRKLGVVRLFQYTLFCFTITYMCLPLVSYLARLPTNTTSKTVTYMAIVFALRSPHVMCYVCNLMMTNMLAPNPRALGTLNGISQVGRSFAQALAPLAGSSLYAFGISKTPLRDSFVWLVMTFACLLAHWFSFMIDRKSFEGKENRSTSDRNEA
ncbi:hypothetical protein O181_023420 [Austropuccinia psidii MF-1]|uniref:Major facilitator superfamily (MFS) profile domain-containing protein n=1 Tax=Austropuccinia psidii MF-1 TaxID=1389203 RepID=A0A9Q3CJ34_9BASI|nr:hypothetical protein [Austropuccinia psidii MF-1]